MPTDYRALPPVTGLEIERDLLAQGRLTVGRVGNAECRLARARDILDVALQHLARDPSFLRLPAAT